MHQLYSGFCEYHDEERAHIRCARCHVFICVKCQHPIEGETYCPVCFNIPHIKKLARIARVRTKIPIWASFLFSFVFAIMLALLYEYINTRSQNKTFFITFFIGAFMGGFIIMVSGGERSTILRIISLFCASVAIFLGDFLYLRTIGGYSFLSPQRYLELLQRHSSLEWFFMGFGLLNSFLIPAPRKLPSKSPKKPAVNKIPQAAIEVPDLKELIRNESKEE